MYLQQKNLLIRNADDRDAETLCRWWNDGCVMAHAGFPLGLGTTVETIRCQLSGDTDETGRRLIIEISHTPAGEMNYRRIDPLTAEIGIKICDPEKQNRGYGKILLTMLFNELFAMGYRKIILDTNLKNTRAQHVYESLGFVKTAVRENAFTDQLGVPQTTVDYALARQTWVRRRLCFRQLSPADDSDRQTFYSLMRSYTAELNTHYFKEEEKIPPEMWQKWFDSILGQLDEPQRHFEFCYWEHNLTGFWYGKIDKPHHRGYIKPSYGFIMEFFVLPECRRRGIGTEMTRHLESVLSADGAKRLYLTADPITGKPFWERLGFAATGEISPDNRLPLYEKQISRAAE